MTVGLVCAGQERGFGMSMPKVGDTAPDFTLKYFDGTDAAKM